MKTVQVLGFLTMIIISGVVLSHSITNVQTVSSISNNSVPTLIPTPPIELTLIPSILPIETIILVSPTVTPSPKTLTKVQVITASYSLAFGLQPNTFTVKSGVPVRLEVAAKDDGQGCMGSIMVPQLSPRDIQFFTKGQTNVFEFTPQTPGTYSITCAMGVPHGTILVE